VNPEHLNHFEFIGHFLDLAVFHHRFLNAYFMPGFNKIVLNQKVNLKDLEAVDYGLYKDLTWMLCVLIVVVAADASLSQGEHYNGCAR